MQICQNRKLLFSDNVSVEENDGGGEGGKEESQIYIR